MKVYQHQMTDAELNAILNTLRTAAAVATEPDEIAMFQTTIENLEETQKNPPMTDFEKPERETVYQIHVLLYEVKRDKGDESGHSAEYDILQEDEPVGAPDNFATYEEAARAYMALTGTKLKGVDLEYSLVPIKYDMKFLSEMIQNINRVLDEKEQFQSWLMRQDYNDTAFWERPFGAIMQDFIDEKTGIK